MLEEDHQHHTRIESINRKHHDAALDLNFQAIIETDVSDVIQNINRRKSSGWDSQTVPILFKKTASAIAPSVGAIFNHCIAKRFWPTKWKMDTCIQKGRQTSQRKLSPDYSTPIIWQSV